MAPDTARLAAAIEEVEALERIGPLLDRVVEAMPADARDVLEGRWLGHPLHPMLTDLPIGFWTTSWVLDMVGGRRTARVSTAMVGLGVVSAVPTAAAGLVDWTSLPREKQRVGIVHLVANTAATAAYALSFVERVRGRRGRGVLLGLVGATLASAGGYLGGHLVFGSDAPSESDTGSDEVPPVSDPLDVHAETTWSGGNGVPVTAP